MLRNENGNNERIGECRLTLTAYIIINIHREPRDLQWLVTNFPIILDSLCVEWRCALKGQEVEYDDWSYCPGGWMRAHIAAILVSRSESLLDVLVNEKNVIELVAKSLAKTLESIKKTILLHNSCTDILRRVSRRTEHHSKLLDVQIEGGLAHSLSMIEGAAMEEEYETAKAHCKEIGRNMRAPYLEALSKVDHHTDSFNQHVIGEILSFVW